MCYAQTQHGIVVTPGAHSSTALDRQDLSCMYLAHHEPESKFIIDSIISTGGVRCGTCSGTREADLLRWPVLMSRRLARLLASSAVALAASHWAAAAFASACSLAACLAASPAALCHLLKKGGGSLGFLAVIKGAFLRRQPAALCHLLHTQVFSFSSVCLSFCLSVCLSFFLIFFVSFFVSFFLSFFLLLPTQQAPIAYLGQI